MKCKESTMKTLLTLLFCLGSFTSLMALDGHPDEELIELNPQSVATQQEGLYLPINHTMRINVVGQGVAPTMTVSPAQAYAMAKRAATVEAYRLIAEKVKGVYVEGKDVLRNMMIKSTDVNLYVSATIRNASVVETKFENGLCEVEMEVMLRHRDFN